jgi:F420-non-reducing hydrogenase iron-sulfur subunit
MSETFEPRILSFLCNWCSYAGADLAGVSRLQYPPTMRVIRVMCSGRVDPGYVIDGLKKGFDGVFISGCHIGDCHYIDGNLYTLRRMAVVRELLDVSGIGQHRMELQWSSAAEGQLFADNVKKFTQQILALGPFDPARCALSILALEQALDSPRVRWLIGCARQLTERKNAYQDTIPEADYEQILREAAVEEYEKAMISLVIREEPRSVREMAELTGLPVYTVSNRLNELERRGQAGLSVYDGRTPKFLGVPA